MAVLPSLKIPQLSCLVDVVAMALKINGAEKVRPIVSWETDSKVISPVRIFGTEVAVEEE
jgi:hypothetical protein